MNKELFKSKMKHQTKSRLEIRIDELRDMGLQYNEFQRAFVGDRGKIDQDIVEFGNDLLYDKHKAKLLK